MCFECSHPRTTEIVSPRAEALSLTTTIYVMELLEIEKIEKKDDEFKQTYKHIPMHTDKQTRIEIL